MSGFGSLIAVRIVVSLIVKYIPLILGASALVVGYRAPPGKPTARAAPKSREADQQRFWTLHGDDCELCGQYPVLDILKKHRDPRP